MTDDEVKRLRVGDYLSATFNGRHSLYRVTSVEKIGVCHNPASGANGHAYALLHLHDEDCDLDISTSLASDEYSAGQGYPAFDAQGQRIRGWCFA